MAYNGLIAAEAKLPASHKGTGVLDATSKPFFDAIIEEVGIDNGTDVIIMGTKNVLKKMNGLANIQWASELQKQQMNELGRLGSYEGTTLIELPQRLDYSGTIGSRLMPNNKLFIMPVGTDKFIKFVHSGETEIFEITEKADLQDDFETYEIREDMGVDVVLGQYFGVWTC